MTVPRSDLPNDVDELKTLIAQQAAQLEQHQHLIERQDDRLSRQKTLIETLEERLRLMMQHRFGRRSEQLDGQLELQLFDEAELAQEPVELPASVTVAGHSRQGRRPALGWPDDLQRVKVVHDLDDTDKTCPCGQPLRMIGEQVSEQLAVIPQQYFVISHHRLKYACRCQQCIRTASMPKPSLPGTQASASLLAHTMVSKYLDGLPLYRQEQMAKRAGITLPRAKLARWLIDASGVLQPIYNLLQDTFFSYDIVCTDATGIQVLKEAGRRADQKSYLWIRRGGPPDRPVVLVDYEISKSGQTVYALLDQAQGYLVSDAASDYNLAVARNGLQTVLCNDHCRRKFAEVLKSVPNREKTRHWAATTAIGYYKKLYRIEREIKALPPDEKYAQRQARAVPIWTQFIAWAQKTYEGGVAHRRTREALAYLLNHREGLRRYCDDGRLPISNILTEHVAKTIAVARKNFLFADTPNGAEASARIYAIVESAKANGHHVTRYLAVVLSELPNVTTVDDIEALMPWAISTDTISQKYAALPAP
jgi:transposase